jgi:uncharacterized protein YjbJ (UPF0337 family)
MKRKYNEDSDPNPFIEMYNYINSPHKARIKYTKEHHDNIDAIVDFLGSTGSKIGNEFDRTMNMYKGQLDKYHGVYKDQSDKYKDQLKKAFDLWDEYKPKGFKLPQGLSEAEMEEIMAYGVLGSIVTRIYTGTYQLLRHQEMQRMVQHGYYGGAAAPA